MKWIKKYIDIKRLVTGIILIAITFIVGCIKPELFIEWIWQIIIIFMVMSICGLVYKFRKQKTELQLKINENAKQKAEISNLDIQKAELEKEIQKYKKYEEKYKEINRLKKEIKQDNNVVEMLKKRARIEDLEKELEAENDTSEIISKLAGYKG